MTRAVIDRFEGALAVLLVGEEERELNAPREQLPAAAREGDWLRIELLADDTLGRAELDRDETAAARRRVREKLKRLRARGRK